MYINDYKFPDNKIPKENLSKSELILHNQDLINRLSTLTDKETFGELLGNICDVGPYIHIIDFKNTPKKFDLVINDVNHNNITIELPFDNSKNKYKIIENNLTREYKIQYNEQDVNIELTSIEFKNNNISFKKNLSFTNGNLLLKINDYLGFLNIESKEDTYNDEEQIKDLILNYKNTPTTEELFFDVKNKMSKKYDSIQLLYKKTLIDINDQPDEILETNGSIKKFLVTRNNKQFDQTNELDKLDSKYK